MIPRWFRPSFWREQSRRVESMADPADRSWDRITDVCDRCGGESDEWVSIEWVCERDTRGGIEVTAADPVAVVCLRCAPRIEDPVRSAVAKAVQS